MAVSEDSGMAGVLGWLLRDGAAPTAEHAMSVTSLQVWTWQVWMSLGPAQRLCRVAVLA